MESNAYNFGYMWASVTKAMTNESTFPTLTDVENEMKKMQWHLTGIYVEICGMVE